MRQGYLVGTCVSASGSRPRCGVVKDVVALDANAADAGIGWWFPAFHTIDD